MKATAKDLRFHSKEILESVSRGEEVVITYRGKAHAKIIPVDMPQIRNLKNDLLGIWKDYDSVEEVDRYIRNIRRGRYHAG